MRREFPSMVRRLSIFRLSITDRGRSRNCTKHSVRCDYMDVSKAGDEPAKGSSPADLLVSTELQQALDNWRLTGQSPLAELRKSDLSYWTRFSTIDLRLIHHITTLSSDLYRRGYSLCTPWTPKMSKYELSKVLTELLLTVTA